MSSSNVVRFMLLFTISILCATAAQAQYYAVTGTHTGVSDSGARPARQNILHLQNDTPTWSLYIQALSAMQNVDENDLLSYFQIAGIHGRPYVPWDNVSQAANAPPTGYCTHNSVLFLTWHRPYVALYEQILASHVQSIAQTYRTTLLAATYQAAADNFRIPYWDWASIPTMPAVVNQPSVQITTASGVETVENPLFQYAFQTFPLNPAWFPSSADDGFLANDSYTIRGATASGSGDDPTPVNQSLGNLNLMANTYRALVKQTTFDAFCTTATSGTALEGIHNEIHGAIGLAYGHMSYLSYAAFDPIFWLHHANVDRLFAIWQAIYYNQNLTPLIDSQGTFTIQAGNLDTQSTLLQPFPLNTGGQWYTSSSSWKTSTFGYTYPEIQDWDQTAAQLKNNVSAAIKSLYDPQGTPTKRSSSPSAKKKDWSVSLSVDKYDLKGERFIIRVFLGQVPDNPQDWPIDNTCVGSFSIFPPISTTTGSYPKITAYSEIDLTNGLTANGIDGSDVAAVEKWLKVNLSWRVQKFDLSVVPNEQVPSLYLVVQDQVVTLPQAVTELPTYGKATLHPGITQGNAVAAVGRD